MSAPFFIPFNHMPTSVSVKTGSYTIPAGYYARAVVNLKGAATFTIDTATALQCTSNSVLGSDNLKTFDGTGVTISGSLGTTASTSGNMNAVGSAFTEATDEKVISESFWLPTGTVINGTGTWRATVELYAVLI